MPEQSVMPAQTMTSAQVVLWRIARRQTPLVPTRYGESFAREVRLLIPRVMKSLSNGGVSVLLNSAIDSVKQPIKRSTALQIPNTRPC